MQLLYMRRTDFVHVLYMQRTDLSYPYHLSVFKDDESKTEAKINSGPRVSPSLVGSLLFACKEHAQSFALRMLSKYTRAHTHKHACTLTPIKKF